MTSDLMKNVMAGATNATGYFFATFQFYDEWISRLLALASLILTVVWIRYLIACTIEKLKKMKQSDEANKDDENDGPEND